VYREELECPGQQKANHCSLRQEEKPDYMDKPERYELPYGSRSAEK
jgi:hypothetical protein